MTSERRARADRAAAVPAKRLVAHYDWPWQRQRGIHDGDPVVPDAPCARIRAGYWCEDCANGFGRDHDHDFDDDGPARVAYARVELAPDDRDISFLPSDDRPYAHHTGAPNSEEIRSLQDQVRRLPIGTVVERFGIGIGIAPRFVEGEELGVSFRSAER